MCRSSTPRPLPFTLSQSCESASPCGVGQTPPRADADADAAGAEGDEAIDRLEMAGTSGAVVLPSLIASLEAQLVELKSENAAQKEQIVQLGEADVIIKVD